MYYYMFTVQYIAEQNKLINRLEYDPNCLSKILWTNKTSFHNNALVDHHNHDYLSDEDIYC